MATHQVRTRPPRSNSAEPAETTSHPDDLSDYLADAAHYPGGHAPAVGFPRNEAQLASLIQNNATVLPVGAQSSLTGGATPMGELVLSLSKLIAIAEPRTKQVTVQPGVTLTRLKNTLTAAGKSYPPVPTYEGATVGGIVSTNAAGAATFKYGTTRDWVEGLSVMLACGELLDLERGQVRAKNGHFEIEKSDGKVTVPVPTYRLPAVPKHSAGYHTGPDMDLVDLFVGSEGTLGVVTSVTLSVLPRRLENCFFLVSVEHESQALRVASRLREISLRSRRDGDPNGLDVVAIEHLDRRCLELLREDGADRRQHVSVSESASAVLLVQIELPSGTGSDHIHEQVTLSASAQAADGPITRLCHLLEDEDLLDNTEMATPGQRTRATELLSFREAVPESVNRRIRIAKNTVDNTINKTAADMVVPFCNLPDSLRLFRSAFESRHLDYAIWGHLSDANLHPNVIPKTAAEMQLGKDAILECGQEIIKLGGSPLAEHGVGRNPLKQTLLRLLYGDAGLAQMRAVKRALDPDSKLAPGVLFAAEAEPPLETPL